VPGTDDAVAIYWDFENAHACLVDEAGGENAYRSAKFKQQDAVLDIEPVAEYAATFGRIVVHRAYADWRFFGRYRDELQRHAIDLIQLFPLTGSKNGADIRLVLDVAEDLQQHPHITHVIVVASDSDYTSLAQRCRKYGRLFVGVGTERTARSYQFACDEFRRYRDLAGRGPSAVPAEEPREAVTLEDAADLVVRAVRRLAAGSGESWVLKAAVRPMVKRLDPAFDESAYGFSTFTDLVAALGGQVAERTGQYDHELAVRADLGTGAAALAAAPAPPTAAARVEAQLKKRGLRLPADRRVLWAGPELICRAFADGTGVEPSFDSLRLKTEAAAAEAGIALPEAEFNKLKWILWRGWAFQPLGQDQGIRLQVTDTGPLRERMVATLLRQLPDPAAEEPAVLAEAFFGPEPSAEQRCLIEATLAALPAIRDEPSGLDGDDALAVTPALDLDGLVSDEGPALG
jgi:hypothetical protein